jgi:DNA repair ATPase RecN
VSAKDLKIPLPDI